LAHGCIDRGEVERAAVAVMGRAWPLARRCCEIEQCKSQPCSVSSMQEIVHRTRDEISRLIWLALDACRYRGMTELDEAELTEGHGRALSAHRTRERSAGHAKPTEIRRGAGPKTAACAHAGEPTGNQPSRCHG
jgi:hypothetical protein